MEKRGGREPKEEGGGGERGRNAAIRRGGRKTGRDESELEKKEEEEGEKMLFWDVNTTNFFHPTPRPYYIHVCFGENSSRGRVFFSQISTNRFPFFTMAFTSTW